MDRSGFEESMAGMGASSNGGMTVIAAFLAMFLTPSLAETNQTQLFNETREDRSTNVKIHGSIILIHDTNPWSEWDGILDYNHGYLAAKLYSKKACALIRMDKDIFPSLEVLRKALHKQIKIPFPGHPSYRTRFLPSLNLISICFQLPRNYDASQGLTHVIFPTRVKNVAQYGKTISDLCRGVPTYLARQRVEGTALVLNPQSCIKVRIFANKYSFGISICGEIPGLR
ncbi:gastrokine-3-like [Notamacropus eugenii]|uniref:gastrokine-3-like n=1 Tax=Notamacropus eugenii TaxID=9315 RepID=UPI003B66BCA3